MDDMDIDIDLGEPIAEQELLDTNISLIAPTNDASPAPQAAEEAVPNKIHIRGVDDLSTAHLQAYLGELFPDQKASVEWIDDTSANFVFEDSETAQSALMALSSPESGDASTLHNLQLRQSKALPSHPETSLQIRLAIATDRKKPRAHEASRYYLMHPDEDPRERRRRVPPRRRRRDSDEIEKFDASMYDDDEAALAARRARRDSKSSFSSDNDRNRRDRRYNRAGDRSASPGRSRSPGILRRKRSPTRNRNSRKELFADAEDIGSILRNNGGRELFSPTVKAANNKAAAGNIKRELFPLKSGASVDEAADLFSHKMVVPLANGGDGDNEDFPLRSDALVQKKAQAQDRGFSIRGAAATAGGDQGFAIRGSAGQKKTIRELFPDKSEPNVGKELFGKAPRRNKAADLFG